jgi:hypothetical protein
MNRSGNFAALFEKLSKSFKQLQLFISRRIFSIALPLIILVNAFVDNIIAIIITIIAFDITKNSI